LEPDVRRPQSSHSFRGAVKYLLHVIAAFLKHAESYYRTPARDIAPEVAIYKYALKPVRQLYGRSLATEFGPLALKPYDDGQAKDRTVSMARRGDHCAAEGSTSSGRMAQSIC
jgi:hypothetical protein